MGQRLFAGIDLDDDVRARLAGCLPLGGIAPALRGAMSMPARGGRGIAGLRWLPPRNWHVTLQFFGRVEETVAAEVRAACERAARARPSFAIELADAGAFASPRRARVLWIGVREGHEQVAALAEALCAQTEPLGFAREQREFRSHVTIARLKTPADVRSLLESLSVPALRMQVAALTLYRSHLSGKGAEYEVLARLPLGT